MIWSIPGTIGLFLSAILYESISVTWLHEKCSYGIEEMSLFERIFCYGLLINAGQTVWEIILFSFLIYIFFRKIVSHFTVSDNFLFGSNLKKTKNRRRKKKFSPFQLEVRGQTAHLVRLVDSPRHPHNLLPPPSGVVCPRSELKVSGQHRHIINIDWPSPIS